MQQMYPDEVVRLREGIPDLGLRTGELGVVCSVWFSPTAAYEVEFAQRGAETTRALVMDHQIEREDSNSLRLGALA